MYLKIVQGILETTLLVFCLGTCAHVYDTLVVVHSKVGIYFRISIHGYFTYRLTISYTIIFIVRGRYYIGMSVVLLFSDGLLTSNVWPPYCGVISRPPRANRYSNYGQAQRLKLLDD